MQVRNMSYHEAGKQGYIKDYKPWLIDQPGYLVISKQGKRWIPYAGYIIDIKYKGVKHEIID